MPEQPDPNIATTGKVGTLETPSRFWRHLGDEHQRVLDTFGPEDVKRRQALRYFTWAWRAGQLRRKEQFRFLLRKTGIRSWIRAIVEPVELRASRWQPLPWSALDRWLYAVAVRLLWDYAREHGDAEAMGLPEPDLGNPPPVRYRGRLISQDLANSALEVGAMVRVLGERRPRHILEIGAGYGRTAYVLLSRFPEARYTVVDIPPAIELSRWYLPQLFPDRHLTFVSPADIDEIDDASVDLAISISSLQEMTATQVAGYLAFLDRSAADGSVYLKQWDGWYNREDDLMLRVDDYPIPARWHRVLNEVAPVQTMFRQVGWRVPR